MMQDEVSYQLGFEDGYRTAIRAVMDGSFTDGSFPHGIEENDE
jgi:hypothetical protein